MFSFSLLHPFFKHTLMWHDVRLAPTTARTRLYVAEFLADWTDPRWTSAQWLHKYECIQSFSFCNNKVSCSLMFRACIMGWTWINLALSKCQPNHTIKLDEEYPLSLSSLSFTSKWIPLLHGVINHLPKQKTTQDHLEQFSTYGNGSTNPTNRSSILERSQPITSYRNNKENHKACIGWTNCGCLSIEQNFTTCKYQSSMEFHTKSSH